MQHRKIEEIEADAAKLVKERDAIEASKAAAVEAFERQQDEKFKDDMDRIRAEASALHTELENAKIAAAGHPLEGKIVYREEERRERFYPHRSQTLRFRGIVTVLRDYADFPERKDNDRFARTPEIGDVIIQRIDANGNKLKSFEKIYPDTEGGLPRGWNLEEESA